MKNLPIGIQTFSEIINENYLYVDKTEVIERLITSGKYYFLSRPRRFGKSLLISTLKEIFSGNKELFKGLYIYDKIKWDKYPVIHISFSSITYSSTADGFRSKIVDYLYTIAKFYNVTLTTNSIRETFTELLVNLNKINRVVILIDEYDKPIIDYITNLGKAQENRDVLRDFYGSIKDNDQYIKFCFLTGVSKFSKVSVFSGLNNLLDITLDAEYSTICGITQTELEEYFSDRITNFASIENISIPDSKLLIKTWYNGYSWDGKTTVYNPFSLLVFFKMNTLDNYWFSTGTPTFLIDKFKESKYKIEEIKNFTVNSLFFDSYNTEIKDYRPLLFQTGYLTIKKYDRANNEYTLGYPNKEVKDAFLSHIASTFIEKEPSDIGYLNNKLRTYLLNNDLEKFFITLKSLIASIPYQLHIPKEAYYHSLFYLIMELVGIKMDLEVSTSQGRIDGVIEFEENIYIIEFKYLADDKNVDDLLDTAINQITTNKYFEPYLNNNKPVKYLAIVLNRDIVEYKLEE